MIGIRFVESFRRRIYTASYAGSCRSLDLFYIRPSDWPGMASGDPLDGMLRLAVDII